MAQQSKTALTSRPLTKALGTASILSMAIAGASVANAIQSDFGVTFKSSAFAVSSDAYTDPAASASPKESSTDTGFASLLRLQADFKHEATGVSVHTSTELAGDRWTGDGGRNTPVGGMGNPGNGAYNSGNVGSNVRLDLGYVQVPFANGTILRVGRQSANWSNCFLVCDDRRDRIITITPTALGTVIVGYDRRQDTTSFRNPDNGDMVNAGLVTRIGGFTTGLLYVHWFENSDGAPGGQYALQGTHLFSPYVSGKLGDAVTLTAGLNYFDGNAIDFGNGQIFADAATSEYIRVGTDLGAAKLHLQWVGTQDGGLVSPAFDTFSSLLNNNPESTANPTSVVRMGGASGLQDYNENLIIAKAGFNLSPQLMVHASVGNLMIDNGTTDDNSMIYDLGASYKINEAVTTSATWGMIGESDTLGTAGNSLVPGSGSTSLANDDIMAASLNLDVKF